MFMPRMIDRVEGLNLKIRISKRVYHFEYCASEDEPRAKGAKLTACISALEPPEHPRWC